MLRFSKAGIAKHEEISSSNINSIIQKNVFSRIDMAPLLLVKRDSTVPENIEFSHNVKQRFAIFEA